MSACPCDGRGHTAKLVVVTGGPGAGKTALLEIARRHLCPHVLVLPEAASIVYGGGFPRSDPTPWRKGAQRAIFHVQRELERAALSEPGIALVLCDRGTLDGAAYWPDGLEAWLTDLGVDLEAERRRYAAVIQLRTPQASAYNHRNPLRIEDAAAARVVDDTIGTIWQSHTRHRTLEPTPHFLTKVERGLAAIEAELPACCQLKTG